MRHLLWRAVFAGVSSNMRFGLLQSYLDLSIDVKLEVVEPETHGYNINVHVLERKFAMERKQRNGTTLRLEEVLVGDETGCMYFTARNGIFVWSPHFKMDDLCCEHLACSVFLTLGNAIVCVVCRSM